MHRFYHEDSSSNFLSSFPSLQPPLPFVYHQFCSLWTRHIPGLSEDWLQKIFFMLMLTIPCLTPITQLCTQFHSEFDAIVIPQVYSRWKDAYISISRFQRVVFAGQVWTFHSNPFYYSQSFFSIEFLHSASLYSIPNSSQLCPALTPRPCISQPTLLCFEY